MALSLAASPEGAARLVFAHRGTTRLARLFQKAPLRVLMPRPAPGDLPCAVLLNTSGGIVGGDALQVAVRVEAGAAAVVTSQAAEKAYRSAGADATLEVDLDLEEGTWLEWLPQETILFDGARLRRRLRVHAAAQARLVAVDVLVFGRRARGERFRRGSFYDRWEIRVGGHLAWVDALRLTPEPGALLDAPFGFAGAGAAATAIYVASDAVDRLDLARALIDHPKVRSGATCVGPVLVLRWLDRDPAAVRAAVQQFCARFRHAVAGLPECVPLIGRT
jgi:urease accessory protein